MNCGYTVPPRVFFADSIDALPHLGICFRVAHHLDTDDVIGVQLIQCLGILSSAREFNQSQGNRSRIHNTSLLFVVAILAMWRPSRGDGDHSATKLRVAPTRCC